MAAKYYRIEEAAIAIGVSDTTLKRWIRMKRVSLTPAIRGGGQGRPHLYAAKDVNEIKRSHSKRTSSSRSK